MAFSVAIPSLLGAIIMMVAFLSLVINLFVLFILWRGGLLKKTSSSIYLLAFSNIFANCIQAALVAFYLGPSILLQVKYKRTIFIEIFIFIELIIHRWS